MTEFDKLNLRVVPIQDPVKFNKLPNYNGYPVKWSDKDNYCSWEEREDVYPGVNDWYVIPPARSTFNEGGLEMGYWVLDIDNHEGDRYKEAVEFLRSCEIPASLTIRTPSGGLHIYYKAIVDDLPAPLGRNKELNLPIEIKVSTGVVAPNGRDRVVIKDLPVAYFTITEDNPISKIAKIKQQRKHLAKKETDPDFDIEAEEFPDTEAGDRHNTLMAKATSLYARGCPPDKIQWWGIEFYRRTNRKEQPNEISNIVRDAMNYVDEGEADAEAELEEMVQEAEEDVQDTNVLSIEDIFPGAEELTGWDGVYAKGVFSDKEELKGYVKQELQSVPPADLPFVRGMLNPSKMREAWANAPHDTKVKYEMFKDSVKMLLQK